MMIKIIIIQIRILISKNKNSKFKIILVNKKMEPSKNLERDKVFLLTLTKIMQVDLLL